MPKFKDEAVKQAWLESIEVLKQWRLNVVSDLVRKVIPTSNSKAITKKHLAELAVAFYQQNPEMIRQGDAMFGSHKDSFITRNYILNQWSDIRANLAGWGHFICIGENEHGQTCGVFGSAQPDDLRSLFVFWDGVAENVTDRRNLSAEYANNNASVQLPLMTLAYLPTPM